MRSSAFLAVLLAMSLVDCHRAQIVDRVPVSVDLATLRSVGILLVPSELDAVAAHDFRADLKTRLEEAGFRDVRLDDDTAEVFLRISVRTTADGDDVELVLVVDLFDQRRQLVGQFEVKADSAGGGGGSLQIKTQGGLTRALARASRAIATHLVERR